MLINLIGTSRHKVDTCTEKFVLLAVLSSDYYCIHFRQYSSHWYKSQIQATVNTYNKKANISRKNKIRFPHINFKIKQHCKNNLQI